MKFSGFNLQRSLDLRYQAGKEFNVKRCIPHLAISMALLPFAFAQAAIPEESANRDGEQEVRQMIEKYRTALLQRDIPALERIWADDYVFVNPSGEVLTKEQRLTNLKSGATTFDSINQEENLTVRVYQNSAVVTSRVTLKGQYSGQPVSGRYASTLVWVKGPAGWQLVSNQLTALPPK
jgi:ketosteroid isomerase-like protein